MNPVVEQKIKRLKRLAGVSDPVHLFNEFEKIDATTEKLREKDIELEKEITLVSSSISIIEEDQNLLGKDVEIIDKKLNEISKEKLSKDDLEAIKSDLKGDKGDAYNLTPKDKQEIANNITVPVVEKIIQTTEIIKEIPIVKEIAIADGPEIIAEKLNTLKETIEPAVIKGLVESITNLQKPLPNRGGTPQGLRTFVSGTKKGLLQAVNFKAGSNVTITHSIVSGLNTLTFNSTGGSLTIITVTGTIDDSNLTFASVTQPTLLNINGAFYQKAGGSITWTWVLGVITLSSPVGTGGNIFGI